MISELFYSALRLNSKATVLIHLFGMFALALRLGKGCSAAPRRLLYLSMDSIVSIVFGDQ